MNKLAFTTPEITRIQFYLGTHMPNWLAQTDVDLFVSHRRLRARHSLPRARGRWALDSGGFTELSMFGAWRENPRDYARAVRRYAAEIGGLDWAATQDWMCEVSVLAATGLTVREHQQRTLRSYLELRDLAPELPWVPILQGWERYQYLEHVEDYERAGVSLRACARVGLGSICRRQQTQAATRLVWTLSASYGLEIHGFGFKTQGLQYLSGLIASADSLAWSYHARRRAPLPGCTHRNCSSCLRYALQWRERMLARIPQFYAPGGSGQAWRASRAA